MDQEEVEDIVEDRVDQAADIVEDRALEVATEVDHLVDQVEDIVGVLLVDHQRDAEKEDIRVVDHHQVVDTVAVHLQEVQVEDIAVDLLQDHHLVDQVEDIAEAHREDTSLMIVTDPHALLVVMVEDTRDHQIAANSERGPKGPFLLQRIRFFLYWNLYVFRVSIRLSRTHPTPHTMVDIFP